MALYRRISMQTGTFRFQLYLYIICLLYTSARLISSLCNFHFNYKIVFSCCKEKIPAIMRYYSVCIPQMIVSGLLVSEVSRLFGGCNFVVSIVKIIVDVFLFFISFRMQHRWVFKYWFLDLIMDFRKVFLTLAVCGWSLNRSEIGQQFDYMSM